MKATTVRTVDDVETTPPDGDHLGVTDHRLLGGVPARDVTVLSPVGPTRVRSVAAVHGGHLTIVKLTCSSELFTSESRRFTALVDTWRWLGGRPWPVHRPAHRAPDAEEGETMSASPPDPHGRPGRHRAARWVAVVLAGTSSLAACGSMPAAGDAAPADTSSTAAGAAAATWRPELLIPADALRAYGAAKEQLWAGGTAAIVLDTTVDAPASVGDLGGTGAAKHSHVEGRVTWDGIS